MSKPKCEKCSGHPEMEYSTRRKVFASTYHPGQSWHMGNQLRRSGHPLVALGLGIINGVSNIANHFFEEVVYKCPVCGDTRNQTERRNN